MGPHTVDSGKVPSVRFRLDMLLEQPIQSTLDLFKVNLGANFEKVDVKHTWNKQLGKQKKLLWGSVALLVNQNQIQLSNPCHTWAIAWITYHPSWFKATLLTSLPVLHVIRIIIPEGKKTRMVMQRRDDVCNARKINVGGKINQRTPGKDEWRGTGSFSTRTFYKRLQNHSALMTQPWRHAYEIQFVHQPRERVESFYPQ